MAGAKYPCADYSASKSEQPSEKNRGADLPVTVGAQQKQPESAIYEPDCEKPKDHDQADLCEQRRMARAAEEAGCVARVQLWLSGLGLALVLGSLWFTGWAAIAASTSADVANRTLVASDRAWMMTELEIRDPITINWRTQVTVNVGIAMLHRNVGKTPALNVSTTVELALDEREARAILDKLRTTAEVNTRYSRLVSPGDGYERPWSPSAVVNEPERIEVLWPHIVGRITYQVIHDDRAHVTLFCYALLRKDGSVSVLGKNDSLIMLDEIGHMIAPGGYAD